MLKSYFTIAWRNIGRHRVTSLINILGLASGISACLIIYLITQFELSYDRFHPDKERIYRITGTLTHITGEKNTCGCVPNPTGMTLRKVLTGFEKVAGFYIYYAPVTVPNGNKADRHFPMPKFGIGNSHIIIAEPEYFDIFNYQWLAGNAATALNEPFKVVLSEKEARRYFESTPLENIVGKRVIYNDSLSLTVSGIVKDWTGNTDFGFKDFISFATIEHSFLQKGISLSKWSNWDGSNQVFVKLAKNVKLSQVEAQFASFSKTYLRPSDAKPQLGIQPLSDLHFNAGVYDEFSRKASMPVLYGLMGIALFILIIAAINFINLSTAVSFQRAKEIGIRKVLGSNKGLLVFQFLSETLLLTLFAAFLAVLMIKPLLSLFHSFILPGVHFDLLQPGTLFFLSIVILITSLLAGFYPAKVLSSYLPVLSLKGQDPLQAVGRKGVLRKSLIVFQFTVSLLFIIGTLIIGNQIHFMLNKDMGFQKDAVVNIEIDGNDSLSQRKLLVEKIRGLADVSMVSVSAHTPAARGQNGTTIKRKGEDALVEAQHIMTDENFLPLYGIKLLAGQNLTHSDTINQLLINATASRSLGFKNPEEAIGKFLFIGTSDRPSSNQVFPIAGVVADFHATSLHEPVKPLFIATSASSARMVSIKLPTHGKGTVAFKNTMAGIEKIWKQVYPDKPFEYSFFDDTIAAFYEKEQQTRQIINAAMIVAISLSCMGLLGLITYTTERRTKEIGVRKVLGASVTDITVMLCKDFVLLVLIAIVIASPVAWYFMHQWLQGFPYRVAISGWVFLLAGISAIGIALIAVSFKAIKAAMANPVKNLRTE